MTWLSVLVLGAFTFAVIVFVALAVVVCRGIRQSRSAAD
jgi:hypothetical protein